ncbi:MAG TPA: D-glycerate dehydrogenase [Polyangiaceae bacterium]|jgi:glyoxylate reductase|nr:D-glycerate dehydrogenase [Polyangiaceae bacterium]
MPRVLVSAPLPGPAVDSLRERYDVRVGADPTGLGHAGILAALHDLGGDLDALITIVTDRVDEAVLEAAPRLKIVGNCGVGVDNIDLDACRRRGVLVTNTPEVLTDATADLTFALILAACRRVAEGDRHLRAGRWRGFAMTELLGVRVTGASLGIIGLGRIGSAVARRAQGFSMRVLYTQRRRAPEAVERELNAEYHDLETLLKQCDIVSLCCPLTPETRGLLSRERIALMKPGAVVVNTSRGACIDERALAEALAEGRLSAAGLDVYEREPQVEGALLASERAVLLPHIGSADVSTRETMARLAAEAVRAVLEGKEPKHRVV